MGEAQCYLQCRREYLAGRIDDQFEGCISASSIPAAIADDCFGVGFRFPSKSKFQRWCHHWLLVHYHLPRLFACWPVDTWLDTEASVRYRVVSKAWLLQPPKHATFVRLRCPMIRWSGLLNAPGLSGTPWREMTYATAIFAFMLIGGRVPPISSFSRRRHQQQRR